MSVPDFSSTYVHGIRRIFKGKIVILKNIKPVQNWNWIRLPDLGRVSIVTYTFSFLISALIVLQGIFRANFYIHILICVFVSFLVLMPKSLLEMHCSGEGTYKNGRTFIENVWITLIYHRLGQFHSWLQHGEFSSAYPVKPFKLIVIYLISKKVWIFHSQIWGRMCRSMEKKFHVLQFQAKRQHIPYLCFCFSRFHL